MDEELQRKALVDAEEDVQNQESKDTTASASQELSDIYSEARIRNIRKYLDSLSSDTRIEFKDRDSLAPSNTGAVPYFKINFALQIETDSIPD